jgi:hypothetical protein
VDFDGFLGRTKEHSKQTQKVKPWMKCGGCVDCLGVQTACICVGRSVQLNRHHGSSHWVLFAEKQKEFVNFKMFCSGFHGKEVAAPSRRRACADVRAFFVVGVLFKSVS